MLGLSGCERILTITWAVSTQYWITTKKWTNTLCICLRIALRESKCWKVIMKHRKCGPRWRQSPVDWPCWLLLRWSMLRVLSWWPNELLAAARSSCSCCIRAIISSRIGRSSSPFTIGGGGGLPASFAASFGKSNTSRLPAQPRQHNDMMGQIGHNVPLNMLQIIQRSISWLGQNMYKLNTILTKKDTKKRKPSWKNCQHMHKLKQMKFWWLFYHFMSSAQKYNQQYSTAPRACTQQHRYNVFA